MIEQFFRLRENKTTIRREVVAGLTTFAAMSYILVVNPSILSQTGLNYEGLITVTALAAAFGSLAMALLTNYPIALAPGMGLNAYFTYTVVLTQGVPVSAALGLVFWNGILFLILSVSGLRARIANAIPFSLRIGVQCGIGLFIAFIGLQSGGIVAGHPQTLVTLGDFSQPGVILAFSGFLLMLFLVQRGIPGAIIIGIVLLTIIGLLIPATDGSRLTSMPSAIVSAPAPIDETFLQLDLLYLFQNFGAIYPILLALLFVDLFDTIGTLIGVSRRANLLDQNGDLPKMSRAMAADAAATTAGALLGTSTTTSYVESAAGIEAGGRSGLTAVTVAGCFLLALIFTPILTIIPPQATAPALVMVGIFMLHGLARLDFEDLTELAPAFVTMIAMPLTFSISEGIALGFITYVVIKGLSRQADQVTPLTAILALVFLLHYLFL